MDRDFLHFLAALLFAGVACGLLLLGAHGLCAIEAALLRGNAVRRRLDRRPYVVTELGARRRGAGRLLSGGATWTLALFAGVVIGLVIWRAHH